MAETRRKFDQDFREGAVRLVQETGKPIAQVARDLGITEGTPGHGSMLARAEFRVIGTASRGRLG
jgi:transposase